MITLALILSAFGVTYMASQALSHARYLWVINARLEALVEAGVALAGCLYSGTLVALLILDATR